jgi:hypothetical protein
MLQIILGTVCKVSFTKTVDYILVHQKNHLGTLCNNKNYPKTVAYLTYPAYISCLIKISKTKSYQDLGQNRLKKCDNFFPNFIRCHRIKPITIISHKGMIGFILQNFMADVLFFQGLPNNNSAIFWNMRI